MAAALYTDLSIYYNLMCTYVDYRSQSQCVERLHQLFGSTGQQHIDLACGTGPHIQYFIERGYVCLGLDIHQPMLDIAKANCPQARFTRGNMTNFTVAEPVDLITCFLYSIHYCQSESALKDCIISVHKALKTGGMFCFNAVDKTKIDNKTREVQTVEHNGYHFTFTSAWHYEGQGEQQSLVINIDRIGANEHVTWQDQHTMVAVSFIELEQMLSPYFTVTILEHNYTTIAPLQANSGNAIFVCVKT